MKIDLCRRAIATLELFNEANVNTIQETIEF